MTILILSFVYVRVIDGVPSRTMVDNVLLGVIVSFMPSHIGEYASIYVNIFIGDRLL